MARPFNKKQTISALAKFPIFAFLTYGRGLFTDDTTSAEEASEDATASNRDQKSQNAKEDAVKKGDASAEDKTEKAATANQNVVSTEKVNAKPKRRLTLTRHAKCRMKCREINHREINHWSIPQN